MLASPPGLSSDGVVTIFVSKITTTKLRNVEMMYGDKNDVYCILQFGDKWNAQTTTIWEGGSDVSWTYTEAADMQMKWKATMSDLNNGMLNVTAMDANKMTAGKLIGLGGSKILVPASVNSMKGGGSTDMTVEVPLFEKAGGKAAGMVIVTMTLQAILPSPLSLSNVSDTNLSTTVLSSLPTSTSTIQPTSSTVILSNNQNTSGVAIPTKSPFSNGILHIKRIKCIDLKNVEMMGKNDPYVTLDFGTESFKTEVKEDSGAVVLFEYLDIKFNVQEDLIKFENIVIKVFDKNTVRSDTLIGSSLLSIKNILDKFDVELDLSVDIFDEKGKKSGHVILYFELRQITNPDLSNGNEESGTDVIVPLNFETIILQIIRIKTFDLKHSESIISNKVKKPYIKIALGNMLLETKVIDYMGNSSPVFDNLDLPLEITKSTLNSTKSEILIKNDIKPNIENVKDDKIDDLNKSILKIDLYDSTIGYDPLVGSGKINIKNICVKDFDLLINNHNDNNNKSDQKNKNKILRVSPTCFPIISTLFKLCAVIHLIFNIPP